MGHTMHMNHAKGRPTQMPSLRSARKHTMQYMLFGLTLHIICGKSPYGPESGVAPSSIINQLANHSQLQGGMTHACGHISMQHKMYK